MTGSDEHEQRMTEHYAGLWRNLNDMVVSEADDEELPGRRKGHLRLLPPLEGE